MDMGNDVAIISQQNIQTIMTSAPAAYAQSKKSHDACIEFGRSILEEYENAGAMSDDLDKKMLDYISRAKKTVVKINNLRSPITKIFDEFRTVFTKMENDVDPAKSGSIPYRMQTLRNQYAAQKRAEEEARRRQEELQKAKENAKKQFRIDAEAEYRRFYEAIVIWRINEMNSINNALTLDNYADSMRRLMEIDCQLPADWHSKWRFSVPIPTSLSLEEINDIKQDVVSSLEGKFKESYRFEIESNRDDIVNRMPSKKKELEKIAKSDAEEAARRKKEMEEKEAEEAARREEERRKAAEAERVKSEIAKKSAEMDGLFAQAEISNAVYIPKTSVKKRIKPLNAEAFPEIISLWWSRVGKDLPIEELSKIFKRQITDCEKLANSSESVIIESEHIEYVEEVKAK